MAKVKWQKIQDKDYVAAKMNRSVRLGQSQIGVK
jgi:hypothetical protein